SKEFALRVVRLFRSLPNTPVAQVMGKQLLRSATSVAANYRATGRARSRAEFIAKLGVVVEEIDEAVFWLEMLIESNTVTQHRAADLLAESRELAAIFAASYQTARAKNIDRR
ncbi:MAG: four helix bundle protein, partial [Terriglobales bacterium]